MADPRLVFLTGATGFIGGRLARLLAARGDRLRCLVRPESDTTALEALGAEFVRGDLDDPVSLERGMQGVSLAYHIAAIYEMGVVDEAALERTNLDGTRSFLRAAERAKVPKAVYVSSTVALGPAPEGAEQGSEDAEWRGPYPTIYHRTKAHAHRVAREAQRRGLPLVIVCPSYVYGPGDRGPAGQLMDDLLAGKVPGLVANAGTFSFVHVDDVAEGLLLAGTRGRTGATYVLSGEAMAFNDFVVQMAKEAGRRPPPLRFPAAIASQTGRLLDAMSRATGVRFPISREGVDSIRSGRWLHPHDRATSEWAWQPRDVASGLPETVAWAAAERRKA